MRRIADAMKPSATDANPAPAFEDAFPHRQKCATA